MFKVTDTSFYMLILKETGDVLSTTSSRSSSIKDRSLKCLIEGEIRLKVKNNLLRQYCILVFGWIGYLLEFLILFSNEQFLRL